MIFLKIGIDYNDVIDEIFIEDYELDAKKFNI
jgi:hypothetical protein